MTTPTLYIPDFSEWQKKVNWAEVVKSHPAAIIRVYNGSRADHQFVSNRASAHAVKVRALGLYAYLLPGGVGAIEHQAQEFVKLVGELQPGEWPIVDYEAAGLHPDMVATWVDYVAAHLHGAKPWLYSSQYIVRTEHLGEDIPATRTWIAAYGPHEPTEGHALWQYTDHRQVPGVNHPCDCSQFHGTVEQLVHAVTVAPAPKPGPTAHARFPFPVGLHPGGHSPSAQPLQAALKATGWMPKSVPESPVYGPQTRQAVAGFNRKHGLNSRGKDRDPAIGPHGWALLMSLAYGTH